MNPIAMPLEDVLSALEAEWREIVREHADLSVRPYDLERDSRHEVRLLKYKVRWQHLVDSLSVSADVASETYARATLTRQ